MEKAYTCDNCGAELTRWQVEEAIKESGLSEDELSFQCPTTEDGHHCNIANPRKDLPAWWATK